jgi:hypothetical protein
MGVEMNHLPQTPGRWPPLGAATVVVVLTGACQDEGLPHFGTLRYESDSFEVWASDGLEACGGTFEYVEGWLVAFRGRVGEHGNPAKHRFYWLSQEEYDRDRCSGRNACAYSRSNVIYSTLIPIEHEIVHTELDARPPSILREGAAEVFGSIESPFITEIADLDLLLDAEQISGYGYPTAGRFSRFIIERHGLDSYFELYQALDGAQGRDAFAAGVADVLGVELPTLVADFEQSSPCSVDRWRYFDHECSALPLTPWQSPTRWADAIDLSCAAADVIGPRRELVWTRRALEVEQAGSYELSIESPDPTAQVAVFSCDVACYDGQPSPPIPSASVATGGRATVFLAAGRHWLQVEHAADGDAPVSVVIER